MRKFLLLLLVAFAVSTVASAQNLKFGKVNTQEIIELLPETDSATVKIEKKMQMLQEQVDILEAEYKTKIAAFERDANTLQGIVAEQRKKDLYDLQMRIQNFSKGAQQELEEYRMALTQPIFKKVQDAINKVSKVNLITFVMDDAQPMFIYMDESAVKDLTPLVKLELKVKDRKAATTAR